MTAPLKIPGRRFQRDVWLHNTLLGREKIYAFSGKGDVVSIPRRTLARLRREYAFVNTESWSISLHRLRQAANTSEDHWIQLAMYLLDEQFIDYPGLQVAETLANFEGWYLCVSDADAEDVKLLLRQKCSEAETVKPMSLAEARRQWKGWVESFTFPDKPTKLERYAWGRQRGITQKRIEELQAEFSPEYWKRAGAPPGAR